MSKAATGELVWLDKATAAIERAATVGDAKEIIDKSAAIKVFAAKQGWSRREVARVGEIEVRATARLGELLKAMPGSGRKKKGAQGEPLLSDLGVTRKQSHVAQAVASVPKREREAYLAKCRDSSKPTAPTVTAVKRMAKEQKRAAKREAQQMADVPEGGCTVDDLLGLVDDGVKFGTIYADPPWAYGNQGTRAATDNHYSTMSLGDIAALPIKDLAADESHLHLWTTNAFLFDAKDILEAWGFEYKSCFVWVKPQMGIGNYWRVSHEFMLLGVRGGLTFSDHSLMSWMQANRSGHSQKPEAVRMAIESASPAPRLELFGRRSIEQWMVWGNEVERDLFTMDVRSA